MKEERREFLTTSSLALLGVAVQGLVTDSSEAAEPIIDIHQHVGTAAVPDASASHQRTWAPRSIRLPAGRSVVTPHSLRLSNGCMRKPRQRGFRQFACLIPEP